MLAAAAALPLLPGHDLVTCPLRALTGVPCPLCGMTTSVVATVHLDVGDALAANPAGIGAVLAALLVLVARPRPLTVPSPIVFGVLALMWLFELHRFAVL